MYYSSYFRELKTHHCHYLLSSPAAVVLRCVGGCVGVWWPQPSLRAEEPLWIWTEWSYRQPRTTPSPPQHQCDSAQCEPAPVSGVWVEDGDQEAAHHLTMAPQGDTPSSTPRWVHQGAGGLYQCRAVQEQCRGGAVQGEECMQGAGAGCRQSG